MEVNREVSNHLQPTARTTTVIFSPSTFPAPSILGAEARVLFLLLAEKNAPGTWTKEGKSSPNVMY